VKRKYFKEREDILPSDANSESTFRPVSSLNDWHFPTHITTWSIENFMSMAVVGSGTIMSVCMGMIMGM